MQQSNDEFKKLAGNLLIPGKSIIQLKKEESVSLMKVYKIGGEKINSLNSQVYI